ncbi:hypothetical protein VSR68_30795 [Paraburkholderia phymatum]|uniref:hypothetical protein n=1 Tax=Paraburkholderia phymatum TaxID=148447 RepID=UPI00317D9663
MRLREKGDKRHEMPRHYTLEAYLHAYLKETGLAHEPNGPLFRTVAPGTGQLSATPQANAYDGAPARAADRHRHEDQQPHVPRDRHHRLPETAARSRMHGRYHESTRTTQLYDWRRDDKDIREKCQC